MNIFDEVKQELNISQVVEFYGIKINRAGFFVCPFHKDSHPSASIKKGGNYFNCFVCGAGGDCIKFTAMYFGLSNYEACKKLISDFNLQIRAEPQDAKGKLKSYNEYRKRQAEIKKQKDKDALIQRTGSILAEYHRILWECKQLYPLDNELHIRALQELPQVEYFLECYDNDPENYSLTARKQVGEIERRLSEWNNGKQ